MDAELDARLDAAGLIGMKYAVWAELRPERIAVVDPDGSEWSFAHVNGRANQLVRLLRARGLTAGDAVALVMSRSAARSTGSRAILMRWRGWTRATSPIRPAAAQ